MMKIGQILICLCLPLCLLAQLPVQDIEVLGFDPSTYHFKAGHGTAKYKDHYNLIKVKDKSKYTLTNVAFNAILANADVAASKAYSGLFYGKKDTTTLTLTHKKEARRSELKVTVADTSINRLRFSIPCSKDEHFIGFGEQFSQLDMKGEKVPIWVQEQGIGRGDQPISMFVGLAGVAGNKFTTYAPMPFFISTKGRAFYLKGSGYMEIDMTDPEQITFEVWDNSLELITYESITPLELIAQYTREVGRMPELPNWAYGTWLGLQGGKDKVEKVVDESIAAGVPVSAVWVQDWVGKRQVKIGSRLWWWWQADTANYGDFKQFCQQMNDKNVKVLGYINSYLAIETPMGKEAAEKGLVIKDHNGDAYRLPVGGFDAYMVDLTKPAAVTWLKNIIKTNLIGAGLSGWMADFSEGPPMDAVLYSGQPVAKYRNQYTVDWVKLNREAIQEADKEGEIVFFNRSGFSGSTKYSTLFWAGDQMHSYGKNDGLPAAILGVITGGISGISINHSDVGGYTTVKQAIIRSKRKMDLFKRWTEVNAFMPVFRTHEGLRPELNVQPYTNNESMQFFARMAQVHEALKFYFQQLVKEASKTGAPVIRHPYLNYPNKPELLSQPYHFMVGTGLYVAPVVKKNAKTIQVTLPNGHWEHAFTGKDYEGGQSYTLDVPYGSPAVFINKKDRRYTDLRMVLENFR